MSKIYNSVNERVRRQISFSRELIMSSKKLWDARRATEDANPIGGVVKEETELPNYSYDSDARKNVYIK